MGLDMYLYRQREGDPTVEERWSRFGEGDSEFADGMDEYNAINADIQVAYWRKANAIHKWFVDNFQDGVDECQYSQPISREALAGLVQRCKRILDNDVNGMDLLPTEGGFFFGSTDYDEGYTFDLKDTIAQLEPLLSEHNSDVFIYQSSW